MTEPTERHRKAAREWCAENWVRDSNAEQRSAEELAARMLAQGEANALREFADAFAFDPPELTVPAVVDSVRGLMAARVDKAYEQRKGEANAREAIAKSLRRGGELRRLVEEHPDLCHPNASPTDVCTDIAYMIEHDMEGEG